MTNERKHKPYEILRLPTTAGIDEINTRSSELSALTMDKAAQVAYRNAAVAIRQNPVERACAQFWEPPRARYDDETIDDFCRRNHPSPVDANQLREQAAQFRDQACTSEYQARQLLPQLRKADSVKPFEMGRIPRSPLEAILSPWEFFI